jgi:hypothetical protein
MRFSFHLIVSLLTLSLGACSQPQPPTPAEDSSLIIASDIEQRLAQFAPTPLTADLSALGETDRAVLNKLVEAARYMDQIFLIQAGAGNPALQSRLATLSGPAAEAARQYFEINFGPWDRLQEREPFVGTAPHPEGAGYYPEDLTKEEFERWLTDHPQDREAFQSLTTVVRRLPDGGLKAIPYSEAYRVHLEPAAALLREAAALTTNDSLRHFLELRADAFLTDGYFESDKAWMDLDAPVEVTIGPYETYEDGLFEYKAGFEAFVTVALPEESAALERFKARLPWLERGLPIPEEHKNLNRGSESPIRVVDVAFVGGDSKAGVQTVAFNLPNDEKVREEKGSKKVLLRNIMRAKYDQILLPIAQRTLAEEDQARLSFEAFFQEVLHHELSHGLGPGKIVVDGRETEVRLELKELYSTLEEAKADVMGVYNLLALMAEGEVDGALRNALEPTYLAGLFRAARFGLDEAHGQGVVAQFNYLIADGTLTVNADGRFHVVSEKFSDGIRALLHDMLMLQATGDAEGTRLFLETYGKATPELRAAIARLDGIPVDIRPVYAFGS